MAFREYIQDLQRAERGSVPQSKTASLKMVLVYPNQYRVGMASLGFQTVYRMANENPAVRCERAFMYQEPFRHEMRTMESGQSLRSFDLVGFSLSFELDLLNIIQILLSASIPVLAQDRGEQDPLIMIGGVVTSLNPAPLLPFVDGLFVGEAEVCISQILNALYSAKKKRSSRLDKRQTLSEIEGVFIPKMNETVKRQILPSLESCPTYTPIVTRKSHFENMFIVEVGRGCTRRCLFCAAKKVYHPYRFRSLESIVETIARWNPGTHRIGLGGAALSDYPDLELLCETLVATGYEISLSSIRADRVTSNLANMIEKGKIKSFTIAPEAGTENLRKSIGKGIKDDTLRDIICLLSNTPLEILKLYFLVGLPGENDEDIINIVRLVQEFAGIFFSENRKRKIQLSVNAFIPKPFTEFQWCGMADEKTLAEKRKCIQQGLKREKNIILSSKSSRNEVLQGLLALGDEQVGMAIFDSVANNISWKRAVKNRGIDIDTLIHQKRSFDTRLPWDFVQNTISKKILWQNYYGGISSNG